MKVSRLPAALAYKLIRRGCSPADLATLAMLWPRGGHVPQQTKLECDARGHIKRSPWAARARS
jgi:hypothetical protein